MTEIRKIAVIGSGVMGMGIAAQCANAGYKVDLLDIVPEGATDRDAVAKAAIKKALKTDPAPFMHKSRARYVTPGNLEDHLDRLADVDWIIEVIVERADIKQAFTSSSPLSHGQTRSSPPTPRPSRCRF